MWKTQTNLYLNSYALNGTALQASFVCQSESSAVLEQHQQSLSAESDGLSDLHFWPLPIEVVGGKIVKKGTVWLELGLQD